MKSFAEEIKYIRTKALRSQQDFAAELGVSFSTVNRWENGKTQPTFKTLRLIDNYCKENNMCFELPAEYETSSKNVKPKVVSLFSGCGGLDLGFQKAGFDIIWANDFDTDAQAVYKLNLGEIDGRDILTIDENEIPECDVVTAGFPCQPFSNAGNRKGVHDSRGMLYKECLRIIEMRMPKVILFENVRGLLSTKYIDGRKLADVIVEDLSDMNQIGYNVEYKLVNAADYGVPQNRYRVFFVGTRKDLSIDFLFPKKIPRKNLTLKNILEIPSDIPNQVDWKLSPQALEMIEHIPEGGSW